MQQQFSTLPTRLNPAFFYLYYMLDFGCMKKTALTVITLFFALGLPAMAGSEKTITLKDGSKINGRIIGIENGRYVIDSVTVGTIRVKQSDVITENIPGEAEPEAEEQNVPPSLPYLGNPTNNAQPGPASSQIKAMQARIMSDPGLLADVQSLSEDPAVMEALSDPSFVQAIQTGNMQSLQSSPHLIRLLSSPKMQVLIQKLRAQQQ